MSDKTNIDLSFKILSKAIADIVCDLPVPGGPSTKIYSTPLFSKAFSIFLCSSAKGRGDLYTNLSVVSSSSHESSISFTKFVGLLSTKLVINLLNNSFIPVPDSRPVINDS